MSIGARTKDEMAAAAVASKTVANGEGELSIELSGNVEDVVRRASDSVTPRIAAKKLRKNVSNVRCRMV